MHLSTQSTITFCPVSGEKPGIVLSLLERAYCNFLKPFPQVWAQEQKEWAELDSLAFSLNGNWIFLTKVGGQVIGLGSFDPRGFPVAVVGHNCIIPQFQGLGYGKRQMVELLRVISSRGFTSAQVSTGDHDFFIPAQRMYLSCGFKEVRRGVEPPRPFSGCKEIEYELVFG